MTIAGVSGALPPNYYRQDAILDALSSYWSGQIENPRLLNRLHSRTRVDGRYLVMPLENYRAIQTWGESNAIWIEAARDLGEKAIRCALQRAGFTTADIGALFFVSVTGISSPSVDAMLVNRMKLSPNVKRIPIFGLGCVAGAAGIARAADYVRAYPAEIAVLLSVELCSLTLQRGDLSVANMISSGLFGDGAAAVVIAGSERAAPGPRVLATRSVFYPDTEHLMGWDISEEGFRIVLSPEVPNAVVEHLGSDVDEFLRDMGLSRRDIGTYIMHTGGPKVIEAAERALDLRDGELQVSWDCLRRIGNLSSASVLFVLEDAMMRRRPAPGTLSLLAAMGPGFCSELVLLKW